jgi:CheY-like chemotaxis protein
VSDMDGIRQRVLVVDDNLDTADSMAMLLGMRGFDAEAQYGSAAALEAARVRRPNVVLLDISMPGMDGFQFALRLRADPAFAETVVIGITGWGLDTFRIRAHEFGFDYYLLKPVDCDQLHELLASAAGGREQFVQEMSRRTPAPQWSS